MKTLNDLLSVAKEEGTISISNPILVAAADQLVKDREQQAITACKGLIDNFTTRLKKQVEILRDLRKKEATQDKLVKAIDRATKYFAETGNPLPVFFVLKDQYSGQSWCQVIGIPTLALDDPAWTIPADWVASS